MFVLTHWDCASALTVSPTENGIIWNLKMVTTQRYFNLVWGIWWTEPESTRYMVGLSMIYLLTLLVLGQSLRLKESLASLLTSQTLYFYYLVILFWEWQPFLMTLIFPFRFHRFSHLHFFIVSLSNLCGKTDYGICDFSGTLCLLYESIQGLFERV
jgi:hypothetical protein